MPEMDICESYIISRYLYRMGMPGISDETYDKLHDYLVEKGELIEYTTRTYDDDPVPYLLLDKFGIIQLNQKKTMRDTSFLSEDKSMSIKKVDNMEDLFSFFNKFPNEEKLISIKLDGINVKNEFDGNELKLSLTRGRAAEGVDVTDGLIRALPPKFDVPGHRVITGEVFVASNQLQYFKETYDKTKHKTTRTSALSLLRKPEIYRKEDYRFLKVCMFSADGIASTVEGTYKKLNEIGFSTPPYLKLEKHPVEFEHFKIWMDKIMDQMFEMQEKGGLPADGLVIELNDYEIQTEKMGQYDERQIAVKFGHWAPGIYEGVITSILMEQKRVFCGCKVLIEPVTTSDGCCAVKINNFNPSFLLDFGLTLGSRIQFERQSGTINVLINHKKIRVEQGDLEE